MLESFEFSKLFCGGCFFGYLFFGFVVWLFGCYRWGFGSFVCDVLVFIVRVYFGYGFFFGFGDGVDYIGL